MRKAESKLVASTIVMPAEIMSIHLISSKRIEKKRKKISTTKTTKMFKH